MMTYEENFPEKRAEITGTVKRSEQFGDLVKGLAKFNATMEPIGETGVNPHLKTKYTTLKDIMKVVKPGLAAQGIVPMQDAWMDEKGKVNAVTYLFHESGQWMESQVIRLPGGDSAQKIGSAITYAKRYSITTFLGLAADADDDGNEASGVSTPPQQQRSNGYRPNQGAVDPRPPAHRDKPQTPASEQKTVGLATDAQKKMIYAITKKKGIDEKDLKEMIAARYGVLKVGEMKTADASEMIKYVDHEKTTAESFQEKLKQLTKID